MGNKWNYVSENIAEFALWTKAICDTYNFKPSDLKVIRYVNTTSEALKPHIRFTKEIPMIIDVPISLIAKKDHLSYIVESANLTVQFSSHPDRPERNMVVPEKISEYSLTHIDRTIKFWRAKSDNDYSTFCGDCTFIHKDDLKFFYKVYHLSRRKITNVKKPILQEAMLKEIYDNSIGFLLRGRSDKELYKKYNIPYKRRILLAGKPGQGKTMTCKWLRELCKKHNLQHRVVTMEEYRNAAAHGHIMSCFKLGSNGIIFFDDLDVMLKDRKSGNSELGPFLTALDGIEPIEGVVNIFTTNYIEELDEAFVRPGRIDLFLTFSKPTEKLRRRFVEELFDESIKNRINTEDLISKTSDYSFAELEEVRKLLCLDFINRCEVDVEKSIKTFEMHRKQFADRLQLGFKMTDEPANELYDDDIGLPPGLNPFQY